MLGKLVILMPKSKPIVTCHPMEKHHAHGLCVNCYQKQHQPYVKYNKKYRQRNKEKLFALFGARCNFCGFSDIRALQLDHIHRSKFPRGHTFRSGAALYAAILRGQFNLNEFQLLCANCNWIKKIEEKEHKPVLTKEG